MKKNIINDLVKSKKIVIPLYIYRLLPRLKIDLDAFVFLMYLSSIGEKIIFNPQKIADDLGIKVSEVLSYIDILTNNKLVSFEIIKNDKNISEEYLSLSYFYEKVSSLIVDNEDKEDDAGVQIFSEIEKEFGRVLSPIEYEIIKAWQESNISDDLIRAALKEAVFSGVNNLRYIDKILYEWQKKGIKTVEDVDNLKKKHNNSDEKVEVFEYNWLEDEE